MPGGRKKTVETFKSIMKGDILVFYLVSPVKAIRGIGKVVSKAFEERERVIWKDHRSYPHRIRISVLDSDVNIPLSEIRVKTSVKRIPMGVSVIPLSKKDFETIRKLSNRNHLIRAAG